MNENGATVYYEKRFFETVGKITKKKLKLVENYVCMAQAIKCRIPLLVSMNDKEASYDIEQSLNSMLSVHQVFRDMPEITLIKAYSKSPDLYAGHSVTTSFVHFTTKENELFGFLAELFSVPLFYDHFCQYTNYDSSSLKKINKLDDGINELRSDLEEFTKELEEAVALPEVGYEIDRYLYANTLVVLEACDDSDEMAVLEEACQKSQQDGTYLVQSKNGEVQVVPVKLEDPDGLFGLNQDIDEEASSGYGTDGVDNEDDDDDADSEDSDDDSDDSDDDSDDSDDEDSDDNEDSNNPNGSED